MPRKSQRLEAKKEQRKPPSPTVNAENSPDTADLATQHFQQGHLDDVSDLILPTCLDPIDEGHHAAVPASEHGVEQGNEIVGLTLEDMRDITAAAARSTNQHLLHPPPQPDHECIQLPHRETPGSGSASTQQPAGLKTTGLESEAVQEDVDDDRSFLQISHVGSFDDLDVPVQDNTHGGSIPTPPPPPQPPTITFGGSATMRKAPLLLLAPRPLPAGITAITNRPGAFQMLPMTTGKGTGKKRGPYKEKFRESCTSTHPSQSSTISMKLNQPDEQFQQRSVFVSHPDPISAKFSTTGGQRSYTNTNEEDQASVDDSNRPYASEDEKEDVVTQAAKRHKRDDNDDGDGDSGDPGGLGHVELTAEV